MLAWALTPTFVYLWKLISMVLFVLPPKNRRNEAVTGDALPPPRTHAENIHDWSPTTSHDAAFNK